MASLITAMGLVAFAAGFVTVLLDRRQMAQRKAIVRQADPIETARFIASHGR